MNDMSDGTRKIFGLLGIIVVVVIFFWSMLGIVAFVNGKDGVQTLITWTGHVAIVAVIVVIVIAVQIVNAWMTNLNTRNFIAMQQSNDDSDVAKFGALQEIARGDREYQKDVRRLEMKAFNRQLPQAQAITVDADEEPQWWVAPSFEEE